MKKPVIIGVGGPVGSGKTLLIERITRLAKDEYKFAVITNDIYTKEDAKFLVKNSVLSEDRVRWVPTYSNKGRCINEFCCYRRNEKQI